MTGQSGVQTSVNTLPAPGVAGDFASANPRFAVFSGPGALVAGPNGATVGVFGWVTPPVDSTFNAPSLVNSSGSGPVTGFVHREQQALITAFLGFASMQVPQGYPVTLMSGGDFLVVNSGTSEVAIGQKAYANLLTGAVTFAATGSASTASGSSSSIAAETLQAGFVGGISGNIMTITAAPSTGNDYMYNGTTVSGTNIASGTIVLSQLSPLLTGEALGGIGRYYVSIPEQTVAAGTAISGTYGLLTIGGTVAGTITLGGLVGGSGVATGTYLTQFGTGTGGAGTYVVNNNTAVGGPESITVTTNVETKWVAMSAGAANELIAISDHLLG